MLSGGGGGRKLRREQSLRGAADGFDNNNFSGGGGGLIKQPLGKNVSTPLNGGMQVSRGSMVLPFLEGPVFSLLRQKDRSFWSFWSFYKTIFRLLSSLLQQYSSSLQPLQHGYSCLI